MNKINTNLKATYTVLYALGLSKWQIIFVYDQWTWHHFKAPLIDDWKDNEIPTERTSVFTKANI